MLNSAFDLAEETRLRTIEFRLNPTLWSRYDLSRVDLNFQNWKTIKYLDASGSDFHPDIETVPADTGGLYLFSIVCPVIKGVTEYPAYIGRAQMTEGQNLRKRCREYFTKFSREDERPLITKLFKYWAANLYFSYLALQENATIIDYEKRLINSLLLPFNTEIPEKEIRDAVSAF